MHVFLISIAHCHIPVAFWSIPKAELSSICNGKQTTICSSLLFQAGCSQLKRLSGYGKTAGLQLTAWMCRGLGCCDGGYHILSQSGHSLTTKAHVLGSVLGVQILTVRSIFFRKISSGGTYFMGVQI